MCLQVHALAAMCDLSKSRASHHLQPNLIEHLGLIFHGQHPLPTILINRVFPHGFDVTLKSRHKGV